MRVWLLLFALILAGCSSAPKSPASTVLPDWVTELPIRNGWVYGVGSAELVGDPAQAAQLARNRARLDVLSSLQVNISGSSTSSLTVANNEVDRRVNQYLRSQVPEIQLETLSQVDSFTDRNAGRVYVLMGLSRADEASQLRRQMGNLDMQIQTWKPKLTGDRLARLQDLGQIMRVVAEWQPMAERYRLITGRSPDPMTSDRVQELQQQLSDLLSQMAIRLETQGDQVSQLATGVAERLTGQGLQLVPGQADLTLALSSRLNELKRGGNDYAFIDAQITLKTPSGRVLLQAQETARGVSSLPGQAVYKAMDELADLLSQRLIEVLLPSR